MVVYLSASGDCNNEIGKDCWGYYGYFKVRCDLYGECCEANVVPNLIGFGLSNGILQAVTGFLAIMSHKKTMLRLLAFFISAVSFVVFLVGVCVILPVDCTHSSIEIPNKSYSFVTGYSILSLLVFIPTLGSTFGVWRWGFEEELNASSITVHDESWSNYSILEALKKDEPSSSI